jgi:hypothetical protein
MNERKLGPDDTSQNTHDDDYWCLVYGVRLEGAGCNAKNVICGRSLFAQGTELITHALNVMMTQIKFCNFPLFFCNCGAVCNSYILFL